VQGEIGLVGGLLELLYGARRARLQIRHRLSVRMPELSERRLAKGLAVIALVGCSSAPTPRAAPPVLERSAVDDAAAQPPASATIADAEPAPPPKGDPRASAPRPTGELEVEDVRIGAGPEITPGTRVRVRYVGRLLDGTEFDRTLRRPFELTVGAGEVIAGWDRGLLGMRLGGARRLVIPPELGYGARGAPPAIPPNATLVFDIELVEIP
jgi:FKBP-type peptidyl-prolyl cis-trans isomerase